MDWNSFSIPMTHENIQEHPLTKAYESLLSKGEPYDETEYEIMALALSQHSALYNKSVDQIHNYYCPTTEGITHSITSQFSNHVQALIAEHMPQIISGTVDLNTVLRSVIYSFVPEITWRASLDIYNDISILRAGDSSFNLYKLYQYLLRNHMGEVISFGW